MPFPSPFNEKPDRFSMSEDAALTRKLLPMGQKYPKASFAVMNLMAGGATYGGWNMTRPRFSGSVMKMTVLYAAYRLRERARRAAIGYKKEQVFDAIRAGWKAEVERSVAGPANFPNLQQIFEPFQSTVEFRDDFKQDLNDMVEFSDKEAAGRVIRAMLHQYIGGAFAKQDFVKESVLWVGGDYAQLEYAAEPISKSHYAASPKGLLRFLGLLHTDAMIDAATSKLIKSHAKNFWAKKDHFNAAQIDKTKSYGKLGWEYRDIKVNKDQDIYDAGVIHRKLPSGGTFQYAFVIQGLLWDEYVEVLEHLDKTVINHHFGRP